jgi:hypothetical protein
VPENPLKLQEIQACSQAVAGLAPPPQAVGICAASKPGKKQTKKVLIIFNVMAQGV